jgi:hypothetical protein
MQSIAMMLQMVTRWAKEEDGDGKVAACPL